MIHYIIPNEPAVIPTHIKNPNSKRSLEPGGIEFKSTANGIIVTQAKTH